MHADLGTLLGALFVLGAVPVGFAVGWWRGRRRAAGERNPGPANGYALIGFSRRRMPRWFNRVGLQVGAGIAMATLPSQRRHSRAYLRAALGRAPTWREVWRHFHAFSQYLFLRLSIAHGQAPRLALAPGEDDAELRAIAARGEPALYGTMHLGHSDLLGYFLGDLGAHVHMVRRRVGNSADTERLAARYAGSVSYLWVNDWSERVWAMNDALRAGRSLALQCDRPEHTAKLEAFSFLGARRQFPFTIYHLSVMHGLPVVFAFAVPDPADPAASLVSVPPIFRPDPATTRAGNFAAARAHFQGVLGHVEAALRRDPFVWFNFTKLNPPAAENSRSQAPHSKERQKRLETLKI